MVKLATEPLLARKRASVSDAKLAYFEGNFELCLEICASIRVSAVTTASEVALLTARAYLRTGRPREAQNTIAESREAHTTLDAWLTAQMLEASALVRQNEADAGIAMLLDAAQQSNGAHFAIRSEIAFCTALAFWAKREIETAETYLELVDPRSDIIHARALELQAWCHTVRQDYARATAFFRLTLLRLDDCQASDHAIDATAMSTLAIFAAELFDRELLVFLETRLQTFTWSPGLSAQRFVTLQHQALFHEFAGNTLVAHQLAAQAQESAPTVARRVAGWTLRSAIAANCGEFYSATVFAQNANDLLEAIDPHEFNGEERFALLGAAECCAQQNPRKAAELLARYERLKPIGAMLSSADDPRTRAYEAFVAGVVAQANGDVDESQLRYREAFETFRTLGYVRRAVFSANALLKLADDEELRAYISTQLDGVSNFIAASLKGRADNSVAAIESHPIVSALPRAQRQVVVLICSGKTNKEIAQIRNVGEQTIKNLLTKSIFPAFGVSSRAALVSKFLA